jgi:hypothetical protein
MANINISKYTFGFFSIFFLLLFQGGVLSKLGISSVNLILIFLVLVVILDDFRFALVLALFGGIMLDFVSPLPDGLMLTSFLVTIMLINFIVNRVLAREPNYLIFLGSVFGGTIIFLATLIVFNKILVSFQIQSTLDYNNLIFYQSWVGLAWNLIFTYPTLALYYILENFNKKPHNIFSRINIK